MQSYIVRIYRKDRKTLLGMVEAFDGRFKRAFTDRDELWEILNSPAGRYLTVRGQGKESGKVGQEPAQGKTGGRKKSPG